MADLGVNRSVSFVSLDTHPANNSLVVTYEILISVIEKSTNRELTRRSKRDQLQINISTIDKLIENELKQSDRLALNLRALSEQIISKCPILVSMDNNSQSNIVEDVQLHLLYLINRRQTQLTSANHPVSRPQSSASTTRLKSASSIKDNPNRLSRVASGRQRSALSSSGSSRESLRDIEGDVYDYLHAKEKSQSHEDHRSQELDQFLEQFHIHLEEMLNVETDKDFTMIKNQADLDSRLEGLYGDEAERTASLVAIRRASRDNNQLIWMSSNRILICAILRTLRDTKENLGDHRNHSQLSILFCLIRLTTYEDIYAKLFAHNKDDRADLLKVIVADLLDGLVKLFVKLDNYKHVQSSYYNLNSLLVLILNLIYQDDDQSCKRALIQVHYSKLVNSFSALLSLFAKHLPRDLRQSMASIDGRRESVVSSLSRLLEIIHPLSIYREFIQSFRAASQRGKPSEQSNPLDCLLNILNILQLSRPGSGQSSGANGPNQLALIRDQATLNEIYELEMQILKLLNNFLFDSRLKTRIIKKNMALKCILRNIIVFLASKSRTSNTLSPFNRNCSTLLVPFRCLYELSCSDQIKSELFKSKIIIKCLLEYLLSSSTDLSLALNLLGGSPKAHLNTNKNFNGRNKSKNDPTNEIIIEPNDASHYIVCLWINLSSKPSAMFYDANETDLHEQFQEYIQLTIENLKTFVHICSDSISNKQQIERDPHMMIYIHLKLLRNLSQFYKFSSNYVDGSQLSGWLDDMSKMSDVLLHFGDLYEFSLLSVECLAISTHLLRSNAYLSMESSQISDQHQLESTKCLLLRLVEVNFAQHLDEADNDDLILVSINFLATLAKFYEICPQIEIIFPKILEACDFILEKRSNDTEMIVSCLFTLNQLLEHRCFLGPIMLSLSELREKHNPQAERHGTAQLVGRLLDRLAGFVSHGHLGLVQLANGILNKLKQLEEQQSLCDSVAAERRFVSYNRKWLAGVSSAGARATGDEDVEDVGQEEEEGQQQLVAVGAGLRQATLIDAKEAPKLDDDDQVELEAPASSQTQNSEEDDDDDDESLAEEPDLNVIDANSMIRHLTSRREFRADWLRR